jgi:hypothetical protein
MKKREQEAGESDGPVAAAEQQGRHIIQKIRNRNLNNLFELRIISSRVMFKARTADRDSRQRQRVLSALKEQIKFN